MLRCRTTEYIVPFCDCKTAVAAASVAPGYAAAALYTTATTGRTSDGMFLFYAENGSLSPRLP